MLDVRPRLTFDSLLTSSTIVLTPSTRRRLQKLEQIPCVWEGDRRPLNVPSESERPDAPSECVLWVDGSEGIVRAMDMVASDTGMEAAVRTLLRAMEHPHSPAKPARPQKIVVKDRELLFFLRGVLQELDIALDYVPDLPLIDEIFRGLQSTIKVRPPHLPPQYVRPLEDCAGHLWDDAPWEYLGDHQIIAVQLNRWGIETFYVSVLGMLGLDYGILLYRSLESLKKFRASVLRNESIEQLENAFLNQDCLFLTYDSREEFDDEDLDLSDLDWEEIEPQFGNLHPLEGLRSFLYEEEAIPVLAALEALHRFCAKHHRKLEKETFRSIESQYTIELPPELEADVERIEVTVSTLPDLASELFEMASKHEEDEDADFDGEFFDGSPLLREDLIPDRSLLTLGSIPWDLVEVLQHSVQSHQAGEDLVHQGKGLPVLIVQTTRPKAKETIDRIREAGGVRSICFNPGENPFQGEMFDLGIVQLENEELYLFGEYNQDDPNHREVRQRWDTMSRQAGGYCGFIIAMGATGAHRGNPQVRDMLAFYEIQFVSPDDLGLGMLQMIPMY